MSPSAELALELAENDLRRDFFCALGTGASSCGESECRLPEGVSRGMAAEVGLDLILETMDNMGSGWIKQSYSGSNLYISHWSRVQSTRSLEGVSEKNGQPNQLTLTHPQISMILGQTPSSCIITLSAFRALGTKRQKFSPFGAVSMTILFGLQCSFCSSRDNLPTLGKPFVPSMYAVRGSNDAKERVDVGSRNNRAG
jgi:hypothetical protein